MSQVQFPAGLLLSNILEQVIYTCGAQANSAFHPSLQGRQMSSNQYLVILATKW